MVRTDPTHYDPYPRQAAAASTRAYAPARSSPFVQGGDELRAGPGSPGIRLDGLAVAALIIVGFLILQSIIDRSGDQVEPQDVATVKDVEVSATQSAQSNEDKTTPPLPPVQIPDFSAIAYPYDEYWVTQGPHGFSYGHMAIDIAAGKGEPILSPITGAVTELFTDGIGNTVLVIENEQYAVTMLHGEYSVGTGDQVTAGFKIGVESNIGNTFDMQGRSCHGRDCGYHTHLNVYDKKSGSNVDPLELIGGN